MFLRCKEEFCVPVGPLLMAYGLDGFHYDGGICEPCVYIDGHDD